MCMGKTHARQGVPAGIALAAFTPPLIGTPLPLALATAVTSLVIGAAVFPDIDHPEATVAHAYGPITHTLAKAIHGVSGTVYSLTRTRRDRDRDGGHRGLTHTLLFAAGMGVLTWWAVSAFWLWAAAGILFVFSTFAVRALAGKWAHRHPLWTAAGAAWCAGAQTLFLWSAGQPELTARWLGLAVAAGCVVHMVGDCMTTQGCPVFFPVPIGGQVWRMVGTPRFLRFDTAADSGVELLLGRLSLVTGGALGVWLVFALFTQ
jgi:membrane-bound metal-dependent hydrolase YbcI (DUF457 family)